MQQEDYERATITNKPFEKSIEHANQLRRTVEEHKQSEMQHTVHHMPLELAKEAIAKSLHETRVLAAILAGGKGGKEVTHTINKLQEAQDWLERAKKEMGV